MMMRNVILQLVVFSSRAAVEACTVFIVGKEASVDGSVLVSHSNDGEWETDPRLVKVPARDFAEGSLRPVYFSPENYPRYVGRERGIPEYYPKDERDTPFKPMGYIPQVPHTFAYLEETYGAVNEHQVAIGESTCSAVFGAVPLGAPNGTALFSVDALTQVAMERATTARQAVALMGALAEEYGFYGAGEFEGTAESLGVTDPNEAWIFHILPDPTGKSAIWAAQRIPPTGFAVLANMFVIREVDPDDTVNYSMSDSVHTVASEYGWWDADRDGLLDFTRIYSDGEYAHKYYSGRRVWGGYHLVGQDYLTEYSDLQSDPVYPVYTTPVNKVSEQDLFRFHRYTYQGTPFDLGAEGNLGGGPFGSPDRWKAGPGEAKVGGNWERPIGLYRTSDTYVVKSKQGASTGGVLWFGPASALATVFTPFIVGLSDIPDSFRTGHHAVFSRSSAFWASCYAHNIANLKWSYAIQDVTARQNELEAESVAMVESMEKFFAARQDMMAVEEAYLANVDKVVASLWSLSDELLFKYASGFVNEPPDGMSQMVGYPEWWLRAVGFQDGPPPPPTIPKCCHPPKHDNVSKVDEKMAIAQASGKAAMREYLRASSMNT
eukprot:scaffold3576_cov170-Amphora_coffeaeformis.AAC.6